MTYDPVDANDDGIVESDVDNESVKTEQLNNAIYNVQAYGAEGDGSADDQPAIQSAIDDAASAGGGVVFVPPGTYSLGSAAGTDPAGVDYCLSNKTNVTIRGAGWGSFLRVDRADTSAIVHLDETDASVENLAIDAGYHIDPQPDEDDVKAMCVKIGIDNEPDVNSQDALNAGCKRVQLDKLYVTGAQRHAIEMGSNTSQCLGTRCVADDGSGDDDFAMGGTVEHSAYINCWSINKTRNGTWTPSGFEMDDGPRDCYFVNCWVINPADDIDGFTLGKSHQWVATTSNGRAPKRNHAIDCTVIGGRYGFSVSSAGAPDTTDINIENPMAKDCQRGINIQAINDTSGFEHVNVHGEGGIVEDCTENGIYLGLFNPWDHVSISDLTMRNNEDNFKINHTVTTQVGELLIDGIHIEDSNRDSIYFQIGDGELVVSIRDSRLKSGGEDGIEVDGNGSNNPTFQDFTVEDCEISGHAGDAIHIYGGLSFTGLGSIKACDVSGAVIFDEPSYRQYVRTIENRGINNASPERLANPSNGTKMYADSSLRSVAYDGYDHYDAPNSTWREMS